MTLHVTLPDGSPLELDDGATVRDAAAAIGPRLAKAAIAGRVDRRRRPGRHPAWSTPRRRCTTATASPSSPLKGDDPDAVDILRHTASHVMAQAVLRLFPGTKYAIGPTIENGFYYDFQLPEPIAEADLARIEKEMAKIVSQNLPVARYELPVDEALAVFGAGEPGTAPPACRSASTSRSRSSSSRTWSPAPRRRRRGAHHQRLPPGRVHRPLPRPAPAQHRQARQRHLQAHQPRRRLLARRREEPHAHPHLRHRLRRARRSWRRTSSALELARQRDHRTHRPRPRPLQLPRGGPRLPVLPPQGHAPLERDGRLLARRARRAPATRRSAPR